MPRKARKHINAYFFHVMCQGINKEKIFEKPEFIEKYLECIKRYKDEFFVNVIAYCVMPNHVHLLLHSYDLEKLSGFMHKVNSVYAMMYNNKKERVGYVFRDRFKMEGIADNKYLSACILYIHNNPVKAGICKHVADYRYSSYKEFISKPWLINNDMIKNNIGIKEYEEIEIQSLLEESRFLDEEISLEIIAKDIINEFVKNSNKEIHEILNDSKCRKELLIQLHIKNNISCRCIGRVLPLERKKIKEYLSAQ